MKAGHGIKAFGNILVIHDKIINIIDKHVSLIYQSDLEAKMEVWDWETQLDECGCLCTVCNKTILKCSQMLY